MYPFRKRSPIIEDSQTKNSGVPRRVPRVPRKLSALICAKFKQNHITQNNEDSNMIIINRYLSGLLVKPCASGKHGIASCVPLNILPRHI